VGAGPRIGKSHLAAARPLDREPCVQNQSRDVEREHLRQPRAPGPHPPRSSAVVDVDVGSGGEQLQAALDQLDRHRDLRPARRHRGEDAPADSKRRGTESHTTFNRFPPPRPELITRARRPKGRSVAWPTSSAPSASSRTPMPLNEAVRGDTATYLKESVANRLDRSGDHALSQSCAESKNAGAWSSSPSSRGAAPLRGARRCNSLPVLFAQGHWILDRYWLVAGGQAGSSVSLTTMRLASP
jgi:hypothetical protein